MKLKELILHNFGVYAGTEKISFDNSKPVILIGGMNGHGKTTILEAILLSLYGRRSFAFTESKMSFPKYLTKYINQTDGSGEARLELSFYLNDANDKDTSISIIRSWNSKHAVVSIDTTVMKNNKYDEYLSENWDMFVETVLPCALAPLFFFDGEKIAELANSDTDDSIKESIRGLLGIDIIDQAITDVRRIISNKGKLVRSNSYLSEMRALEEDLRKSELTVKDAIEASGRIDIQRQRLESKRQKIEDEFLAAGGKVVASRGELLKKKCKLEEALSEATNKMVEFSAGDIPLLLVLPLLQKIQSAASNERTHQGLSIALEQLPRLLKQYSQDKNSAINVDSIISFLHEKTESEPGVYKLSESGYFQLCNLCMSLPKQQQAELEQLLKCRHDLREELIEIENHLETYIDESVTSKMYKQILELTSKCAALCEQQAIAHKQVELYQAEYDELNKKHQKLIEKAVGVMEDSDEIKRIVMYSGYTIEVLKTYREKLQESKTAYLAETMTTCFKAIVAKKSLISRIGIAPESLNFTYYRTDGSILDRSSFSAGEKQLLIIAMLWAIGICSNKEFPTIVDTPLARLDSTHRENLITNYFATASRQMILLSTDSEICGVYYKMLSPSIDHEFTLMYDETAQQSYITRGYFGGHAYDN